MDHVITAIYENVERARLLLERHPLRAYDAVHLASAIEIPFARG